MTMDAQPQAGKTDSTRAVTVAKDGYKPGTSPGVTGVSEEMKPVGLFVNKPGSAVVTVSGDSKPVAGATVKVWIKTRYRTERTDAQGKAGFSDLPAGQYAFAAAKDGYSSHTVSTTISGGGPVTVPIILPSLHAKTGKVSITVLDTAGDPVAGITVNCDAGGKIPSVRTDDEGVAKFSGIPIGITKFFVSQPGCCPLTASGDQVALKITKDAESTATITTIVRPIYKANMAVVAGNRLTPETAAGVSDNGDGKTQTQQTKL